ncbi:uncharacterized protein [Engystomops pustulosus]|uniref:uncharacterized protein n=1 Tax=Engystomops pustulosus TaxID=76066 RepID=UPI003AFA7A46
MESQAMRDYIRQYTLDGGPHGHQGYSKVLLQLFGYTGHGKSSLINTWKCVVDDGPYVAHAKVAGSEEKPETMIRRDYPLTDHILVVDNRGCVKMNKYEIGAIYAQLGNFMALNEEVKWQVGYSDTIDAVLNSDVLDQSHFIVPVLVYSANTVPTNPEEIKEILKAARDITGLFPTVVLTHECSEHLSKVKEIFRRMEVKNLHSLENYTGEDHKKTRGKHETILRCLQEIIKDVEFRMLEKLDPMNEKIERKRFLLEYAHKRELEKLQEKDKGKGVCIIL